MGVHDVVWISHAPSDPTLADGFLKSDLEEERLIELGKIARSGGAIDQANLPTEIWGEVGEYRAHHFSNEWPHITYFGGLWIISAELARILHGFDLGGGRIGPLKLLARDRATPVAGEWFCWNVGNSKETFLPDMSQHIRPAPGRKWRTLEAGDHDLKCSTATKAGADTWIDPLLRGVLFLSFRLGASLIGANLATERAGLGRLLKVDLIEG